MYEPGLFITQIPFCPHGLEAHTLIRVPHLVSVHPLLHVHMYPDIFSLIEKLVIFTKHNNFKKIFSNFYIQYIIIDNVKPVGEDKHVPLFKQGLTEQKFICCWQ